MIRLHFGPLMIISPSFIVYQNPPQANCSFTQVCLRDRSSSEPINLYHKVGHGRLDMYVLNPAKDAKELREFMERWKKENSKTLGSFRSGINVDGKELWLPIANLVSICALLIWYDNIPVQSAQFSL